MVKRTLFDRQMGVKEQIVPSQVSAAPKLGASHIRDPSWTCGLCEGLPLTAAEGLGGDPTGLGRSISGRGGWTRYVAQYQPDDRVGS